MSFLHAVSFERLDAVFMPITFWGYFGCAPTECGYSNTDSWCFAQHDRIGKGIGEGRSGSRADPFTRCVSQALALGDSGC
jgi:hypothetical protein